MSYCVACRYRACLSLIFPLLCTGFYGQSTNPLDSVDQQLDRTLYVPCGETAPNRAHEVRSPTLISPDRRYKAYVLVKANVDKSDCSNVTQFFIRGPKDKSYRLIRELEPKPELLGSGLKMIDWSPQGHFLALQVFWFQYSSDLGWMELWVYDAERERLILPAVDKVFSEIFQKECSIRLARVLGFCPDGQLLLKIGDFLTVDEVIDNTAVRCVGAADQIWRLDFGHNKVFRLPSEQCLRRYGQIEPGS